MLALAVEQSEIDSWTLEVAKRLKQARLLAGLKQSELGEKIGLGDKQVSNYERGVSQPSIGILRMWAIHTSQSMNWLLTGRQELKFRVEVDDGPE